MSNTSSAHIGDLESQQTVLLIAHNPPRDRWRWILLILQARKILISRADKAEQGSLALATVSSSTPPYSVVNTSGTVDARSELTEIVEGLPTSPQVSLDVHSNGDDDSTVSDEKLQHENIARIVKAKDLDSLHQFGGVQGIAEALNTDLKRGIPGNDEDLCSRRMASSLSKTEAPALGFFRLLLKSSNNYIIFLLLVAAALSLGFGIKEEGPRTGWYEGVIIILSIIILVVIPSIRDFRREKSQKQSRKETPLEKRQMVVEVVREGNSQKVAVSNIVFGDIVSLKKGYHVPGDGLLVSGEIYLKLYDGSISMIDEQNPFISYGAKVINGQAYMLVTSVGMNTSWGEMMSQVTHAPNNTPLPAQLDEVSFRTQIIGILISILLLVVLFLRFKLGNENHDSGPQNLDLKQKASKEVMDAIKRIVVKPSGKISVLTTSLTILVVEIVEGVPFFISLAICYWNKKTLSDNASAEDILACVTMGLVTTICTNKTGGLTMNPQEVDMCWIGEEVISKDSFIDTEVLEALCNGIGTPVLMLQSPHSSIEDPFLSWATLKLGMEMENLKQTFSVLDTKGLSSIEEGCGVLMKKKGENESNMFLHWKGPAKTILAKCSHYYDSKGTIMDMEGQKRWVFEQIIEHMQSKDLETIAFAYKQVNVRTLEDNSLTLIGLLGLKDTCWTETKEAMESYRKAGINIILVSEDNVSNLEAIALECGMLHNSDRLVLEGENFRNCSDAERIDMVDKICVIGNSLPSDKLLLVQCLKQKEHIVAMVGVQTNDVPALKEADVGVVMGTWSSDLAEGSADIYIWDGSLSYLVSIVMCGRCTYDNIRKYIQLELTMTIAGLLITTIATVSFGDSPITAIQLFWAALIVAVPGGLALLTERQSEKLMQKAPVKRTESFITKAMWRNIVTQALYQSATLVTFQFKVQSIIEINNKVSDTMIFNCFVLCQVFNQFNARELEMKNVFKGIHRNLWFWVAVGVTVVMQVAFIEIAHFLFGNAKLNGVQWGICFLIGILSWAIDWVSKSTSGFIMDWINGWHSSHTESNLELPLFDGSLTAISS